MITKLCRNIADFFIREKIITEELREVYEYGFELCLSLFVGIIIILGSGLIFGIIPESLTFYIVFCFTRLFCGGFHAGTHFSCKLTFIAIFALVIAAERLLLGIPEYFWFVIYSYSLIIVCVFAPVDNPGKRLSKQEKIKNKFISVAEMLIWLAVIVVMYLFHCKLYHIIAATLFFVATLMLLGIFFDKEET